MGCGRGLCFFGFDDVHEMCSEVGTCNNRIICEETIITLMNSEATPAIVPGTLLSPLHCTVTDRINPAST